jgi:hypothetical protein
MEDYEEKVNDIKHELNLLNSHCETLKGNQSFAKFLGAILKLGNAMNEESGQVYTPISLITLGIQNIIHKQILFNSNLNWSNFPLVLYLPDLSTG